MTESGLPGVCEGPASVRRKGEGPNRPEGEADGQRRPTEPHWPAGSPGETLPVPAAAVAGTAGLAASWMWAALLSGAEADVGGALPGAD